MIETSAILDITSVTRDNCRLLFLSII